MIKYFLGRGLKMKLIVCTDLNNGMIFNSRRQSKDRVLIKHIYDLIGENKLWITASRLKSGKNLSNIVEKNIKKQYNIFLRVNKK